MIQNPAERASCVTTDIELHWEKEKAIVLHAAKGDTSLIPLKRMYRLELVGGTEASVAVLENEVRDRGRDQLRCGNAYVLRSRFRM